MGVADKIAQLAELLASQGCLSSAMGYLLQLPRIAETSTHHATLIHRIAGSGDVSLAQPAASPFDALCWRCQSCCDSGARPTGTQRAAAISATLVSTIPS